MADNITNELRAAGAPDEVERFYEAIDGGYDESDYPLYIDFNKIKPMPASLEIDRGSRNDEALDYYVIERAKKHGFPAVAAALGDYAERVVKRLPDRIARRKEYNAENMSQLLSFGEQLFNNIRDHGAPTWYEWRNAHWGTKWNAYDQKWLKEGGVRFDTAWNGVPTFIQDLSARFPGITLSYKFAHERGSVYTGEYTFRDGEIVSERRPGKGTKESEDIANKILGPRKIENESEAGEDEDDWEDEL